MEKKKLMLISSVMSMCLLFATVFVANRFDDIVGFAVGNETWHHYAAVAPTETKHGSKEFWAKGSETCSIPYFENPGVGCVEHDFSTYDSFEALTFGDNRYVPSLFDHRNGVYPELDNDNNIITYGLYPQTNVNDSSLISALNALTAPESNGWYLYNNEYYAKVSATPYYSNYYFNNGTAIVSGTSYWFKCEPITWNILNEQDSGYYLLSSVLLDAHCYYNSTSIRIIDRKTIYANNYEYSDIRTWLNGDFYNSAFALNNSYLQITNVDNSASTTDSSSNKYACNNTQDKVFLPSYQDYINSSYGFSSPDTICCKTTDWARARGAYYYTSSDFYQYNGYYWTRSPNGDDFRYAWFVTSSGTLINYFVNNFVDFTNFGVRPALSLKIS